MCSSLVEPKRSAPSRTAAGRRVRRVIRAAWLLAWALLQTACNFVPREQRSVNGDSASASAAGEVVEPGEPQPFAYVTIDSAAFDIDRDGEAERIRLLATVERNERGEFLWEDGHHWAVVLENDSVRYTLVERFVPNGTVELFTIVEEPDRPVVIVQTRSGVGCGGTEGTIGLSVERFTFDVTRGVVRDAHVASAGQGSCRGIPAP